MKFDKRISSDLRDVYTLYCRNNDNLLGIEVYASNDIDDFNNIDRCRKGKVDYIDSVHGYAVKIDSENTCFFNFVIPAMCVKEKTLRPYTLNEFLDKYRVCANIRIRQRDRTYQYFGKLIGYGFPTDPNTGKQNGDNDAIVCIGGYSFKLTELFTDYEQYDNMKDIWVPCGVEVEE